MVNNGLRDLGTILRRNMINYVGYNYINLDDCWAGPRDANGELTADPRRFPSGMKALADYGSFHRNSSLPSSTLS